MNTKNKINVYWNLAVFAVFTLVVSALPELSIAEGATGAATQTVVGEVICKATDMVKSDVGKGLAVAAVIILGLAALLGKISWGLGLMVIVGIGLIFGASDIVNKLMPGGTECLPSGWSYTD